jgi:hypothetical protein
MPLSSITVAGIHPGLNVLGATQQFNYTQELSTFQITNSFVPSSVISSVFNFELRNNLFSGFRWVHNTNNTDTYGSLKLQNFVNAQPVSSGTDMIEFNSEGINIYVPINLTSIPLLYMASSSIPSAPASGGIYSVTTDKPFYTSVNSNITGTIVTAKNLLTSGIGTLNGTTGATINTAAITTTSIVNITRNVGTSSAPSITDLGHLSVASIINGTSFTVYSTNTLDIGNFNWQIINP